MNTLKNNYATSIVMQSWPWIQIYESLSLCNSYHSYTHATRKLSWELAKKEAMLHNIHDGGRQDSH